jgi:hypothetical protein
MNLVRRALSLTAVLSVVLIASSAALSYDRADDLGDAFVWVNSMVKFIESGDQSSSLEAGNRGLTSLEKAIDAENNSDRKSKLRDAVGELRKALSHVQNKEWPYADGAAKKAAAILDDLI